MGDVVALHACEGCGTREGIKVLLVQGLSNISKRAHPICRECAGHIGPVDDETWAGLQSVEGKP